MNRSDEDWMTVAIEAAAKAGELGEVPIGACVVSAEGELLAAAHNLTITNSDPTAHAEVLALRAAAASVANYRLTGATVYSTIEPCVMCAGALVNARVARLVYGARDERFGAVDTHFDLCRSPLLNHRIDVQGGVLAERCRAVIQQFFRGRRAEMRSARHTE